MFSSPKAANMASKWVPGALNVTGLWLVGCGQWDMGDIYGDLMVPAGQDRKFHPWALPTALPTALLPVNGPSACI